MSLPAIPPENQSRILELEGSRSSFVDDKTLFVILRDGTIYPVDIVVDGKTVSKLTMASALAQTTIPSVVKRITKDRILVGSTTGPSVLLKAMHIKEDVDDEMQDLTTSAVVQTGLEMDLSDDDGTFSLFNSQGLFDQTFISRYIRSFR